MKALASILIVCVILSLGCRSEAEKPSQPTTDDISAEALTVFPSGEFMKAISPEQNLAQVLAPLALLGAPFKEGAWGQGKKGSIDIARYFQTEEERAQFMDFLKTLYASPADLMPKPALPISERQAQEITWEDITHVHPPLIVLYRVTQILKKLEECPCKKR